VEKEGASLELKRHPEASRLSCAEGKCGGWCLELQWRREGTAGRVEE
jgi:hypothetical protein